MSQFIRYIIQAIKNFIIISKKIDKPGGSYIVEACLIFPFVCLVLVAILIISIYIHDEVVLQGIANIAINETPFLNNTNDNGNFKYEEASKQQVINFITNKAQDELIMKQGNLDIDYQVNTTLISSQVKVNLVKEFKLPFKLISNFLDSSDSQVLKIHVSSFSNRHNSLEVIRGIDFIDDITDEINITNEIKEKYENQILKLQNTINQWI